MKSTDHKNCRSAVFVVGGFHARLGVAKESLLADDVARAGA